ncbi:MAG: hypothetical protein KDA65_13930 [Planctomycetaceae bacterium]|nr:hypothetical protein [Planctomycetaceae bacterium]
MNDLNDLGRDELEIEAEEPVELELVEERPSRKEREHREAYNIVTDTITGANLRKSDNVFQAKVIGICLLIGILVGVIWGAVSGEQINMIIGSVVGGFAGVLLGLFGSGFYLMIYRTGKHLKGDHS